MRQMLADHGYALRERADESMAVAQAAVTGRGLSPACQRQPQLKHAYRRIETPRCMSMALSARRVPSHFQHRIGILVPSTSATWRLSLNDGIDRPICLSLAEGAVILSQCRFPIALLKPLRIGSLGG